MGFFLSKKMIDLILPAIAIIEGQAVPLLLILLQCQESIQPVADGRRW